MRLNSDACRSIPTFYFALVNSGTRHRGAIDQPAVFVQRFIGGRLAGFEKDMKICLTPIPSDTRPGPTHAYFPALGACCGLIEYLTGLYRGDIRGIGWTHVVEWSKQYLSREDYSEDVVRVFFLAFRHSVAHRGISSGVWVDRSAGPGAGRRFVWRVTAARSRPAVQLVEETGTLRSDPPWPCPYTHRAHIHLGSLKVDIRNAATKYAKEAASDAALLKKFTASMRQLYPLQ